MSCTAKTGPLKGPFRASIGNWLGERGTGTQWPPSLDTEKMEMSYWGAALVLLISMSRRGDERREERMSPPVKFLKAWFFPLSLAAAVQGCPVILPLRCNCCETWRNKMFFFFHVLGWRGVTLSSYPPPSQTAGTPFRSGKKPFPCSQERMHLPPLPLTSFS